MLQARKNPRTEFLRTTAGPIDPPERLDRKVFSSAGIVHDPDDPSIDLALVFPEQGLKCLDIAPGKPFEFRLHHPHHVLPQALPARASVGFISSVRPFGEALSRCNSSPSGVRDGRAYGQAPSESVNFA